MSKKPYMRSRVLTKDSRHDTNISSIDNSFLNETSFNSDVDIEIREEIEKKFKKSLVNAKYVFPRRDPTENKTKKSPVKPKTQVKQKLMMEKSLPTMHKMTKSTQESTGILTNLISTKKIHRVSSSIRKTKDPKIKTSKPGRTSPVKIPSHVRSSSQNGNRSKTPVYLRKEKSLEPSSKYFLYRHRRTTSSKRNFHENTIVRPKSVMKKPGHIYTSSMECVIPSAIIKSVSYY
ncbi:hypothetical protein SteCoe_13223 [Stentor coeruleus]|uniref:Uncharacterized protein n=1 Tax=Stentor coeruleus TaxID=5963 RepID=A0A1R2C8X4_9CILI|nr:hypothetical protein SteCoe_13223 [Stentor coeruleus]